MPERNVGITFLDIDYNVATVKEGQYISMLALIQEIGDTLLEIMDTVVVLDDVGEDSFEIREGKVILMLKAIRICLSNTTGRTKKKAY